MKQLNSINTVDKSIILVV